MHFFSLLPLLAAGAHAWPFSLAPRASTACLTDTQAQNVANVFKNLLNNYSNAYATTYLTETFKDYSDSVNTLMNNGCPKGPATLGAATFSNRTAFETGQGGQPNIPFTILNVWHDCTTVIVRWVTSNPGGTAAVKEQVTGIAALVVTTANAGSGAAFAISEIFSEFNSGAWLYDLGIFRPADCPS